MIADKQMLIQMLEDNLKSKLPATDIDIVRNTMMEVLPRFDVEQTECNNRQKTNDIMQMFCDAKEIEGRSRNTIARYTYILNRFFSVENVDATDVMVFHIRDFFMKEKRRGISDRTIAGYRDVFSSFFGWLFNEGIIQKNPCLNVGTIKCRKEIRKPYTDVDIERMKEACNSQRDKAIIAFLLSTGCRISEVCALNISDIDFQRSECTVLGKGNKERTVFINDVASMLLQRYLNDRDDLSEALFIGKGSERLHPGGIRKMLKGIEDKSGVENVHPHRFRRTLATNLINRGMPIQDVAHVLGHDRVDTTMTYIYMDGGKVKSEYKKYSA